MIPSGVGCIESHHDHARRADHPYASRYIVIGQSELRTNRDVSHPLMWYNKYNMFKDNTIPTISGDSCTPPATVHVHFNEHKHEHKQHV